MNINQVYTKQPPVERHGILYKRCIKARIPLPYRTPKPQASPPANRTTGRNLFQTIKKPRTGEAYSLRSGAKRCLEKELRFAVVIIAISLYHIQEKLFSVLIQGNE